MLLAFVCNLAARVWQPCFHNLSNLQSTHDPTKVATFADAINVRHFTLLMEYGMSAWVCSPYGGNSTFKLVAYPIIVCMSDVWFA